MKPCYSCEEVPRMKGCSYCRDCRNKHHRERIRVNLTKKECEICEELFTPTRSRATTTCSPKCSKRRTMLRKKYKISPSEYNEMFKAQEGRCKICEIHVLDLLQENLFVDHCHSTGKIRGLLCSLCNSGLGKFKDNIEYLENAIKYLKENYNE